MKSVSRILNVMKSAIKKLYLWYIYSICVQYHRMLMYNISIATQARIKTGDFGAAVELCSAIHQRYREFLPLLQDALVRSLVNIKQTVKVLVVQRCLDMFLDMFNVCVKGIFLCQYVTSHNKFCLLFLWYRILLKTKIYSQSR